MTNFNKLIISILFLVSYFFFFTPVQAAPPVPPANCTANPNDPRCILGQVSPPPQIPTTNNGEADITTFINRIIELIFSVAGVAFVILVLVSAVQWIMSGGQKEAVAAARGRLTWAVIGLTVLSLAFVILRVLGTITGFTFFH